jgi:competence protein ComEA
MRNGKTGMRALCGAALAGVVLITGALAPEAHAAPRTAAASEGEAKTPVDVNKASADDLTSVPGIGDSIARKIVEFREKNGPFKTVDDLLKVPGIGEKSLQKLRPYLTVGK